MSAAVCCKSTIPAESMLEQCFFPYFFLRRLEKHICFSAKCALARGSSAYWKGPPPPSVGSVVMDAVYGAAMTSVKGRPGERCIARLSAQCLHM